MQFYPTLTATTTPVAESTSVPITSDVFIPGTLSTTADVLSKDTINRTAAYLAKTVIKEALEEDEWELEDMEAQEVQRAAE